MNVKNLRVILSPTLSADICSKNIMLLKKQIPFAMIHPRQKTIDGQAKNFTQKLSPLSVEN